jgi:hypothetical protein
MRTTLESRCVWCARPATAGYLCDTCRLGLEKYPDQNPPIVAAYVWTGLQELEAYLARWDDFERWLQAQGRPLPPTR